MLYVILISNIRDSTKRTTIKIFDINESKTDNSYSETNAKFTISNIISKPPPPQKKWIYQAVSFSMPYIH